MTVFGSKVFDAADNEIGIKVKNVRPALWFNGKLTIREFVIEIDQPNLAEDTELTLKLTPRNDPGNN